MEKDEGLIKDTIELIIKEIQTILSIAYICLVGIGMLFNFYYYYLFGINIFEYSDVLDFLIAPFGDLFIFIFVILSLTIVYLFYRLDSYAVKKKSKLYMMMYFGMDKKPNFDRYRMISFMVLIPLYVFIGAMYYSIYTKRKVLNSNPITIQYTDGKTITGKKIGKTKNEIFLLEGEQVKVIPYQSVVKEIDLNHAVKLRKNKK